MFTWSPKISFFSTMMSPTSMPTRNKRRRFSGTADALLTTASWNSSAQRTASTALANSAMKPSPVLLTIRPACRRTEGWTNPTMVELKVACVASSSSCIRRE